MNGDTKYSTSKTGKQCVGPCYEANKPVVHPFTQEYIVLDRPFCPVAAYIKTDSSGQKQYYYLDECYITKNNNAAFYGNQNNILEPEIEFSCSQFLTLYYKVENFDDALNWITDNKAPIFTKLRIINCALKTHSSKLEIIDDRLVLFYAQVIKKIWVFDIYRMVNRFINIKDNLINFKVNENTLKDLKHKENVSDLYQEIDLDEDELYNEKYNFLITKFANKNILYKFLTRYIIGNEYTGDILHSYLRYILTKLSSL